MDGRVDVSSRRFAGKSSENFGGRKRLHRGGARGEEGEEDDVDDDGNDDEGGNGDDDDGDDGNGKDSYDNA